MYIVEKKRREVGREAKRQRKKMSYAFFKDVVSRFAADPLQVAILRRHMVDGGSHLLHHMEMRKNQNDNFFIYLIIDMYIIKLNFSLNIYIYTILLLLYLSCNCTNYIRYIEEE